MGPVGSAFIGYAVAFAGTIGASLLAAFLLVALDTGQPAGPLWASLQGLLAGGFASSSTLLAVALIGTAPPRLARLRLAPGRAPRAAVAVMVVGVLALGQALDSLAWVLGLEGGGALEMIRRALTRASPGMLALALLGIGVFAGFAEELFFRGFMQTRLVARWPPWAAVTAAALGFGILHLDPVHAALAFVLGLYLGFLVERSGSVVPAVICHAVNNCASILLTALVGTPTGFAANLVLGAALAVVFAGAVVAVRRMVPGRAGAVGSPGDVRLRAAPDAER